MLSCARATRGLRRPSPGMMARLGVPVGGRVRKSRAVEDQSAPIPEEKASKIGRMGQERPAALLARRTRTFRTCSPGTKARLGALGVGRVRMLRAVKGSLGHSPKKGNNILNSPAEGGVK